MTSLNLYEQAATANWTTIDYESGMDSGLTDLASASMHSVDGLYAATFMILILTMILILRRH